jgi:hypothetical protein
MALEIRCVLLAKIQHFVRDRIIIMVNMEVLIAGMLTITILDHFLLTL